MRHARRPTTVRSVPVVGREQRGRTTGGEAFFSLTDPFTGSGNGFVPYSGRGLARRSENRRKHTTNNFLSIINAVFFVVLLANGIENADRDGDYMTKLDLIKIFIFNGFPCLAGDAAHADVASMQTTVFFL